MSGSTVDTPGRSCPTGRGMTASTEGQRVGPEFVAALADRDAKRLESCLGSDVHLRALVPSGFQEHRGPATVVRRFMTWFEDADSVRVLEKSEHLVAGRLHIRYKFQELYSDQGSEVIEQDLVCDLQEGKIAAIDLLCSGHLPDPSGPTTGVHRFDAAELGCGSGLPQEFRRQISAIPSGSTLEVSTRDPSAKEDLPSLARLLGHRVVSARDSADGSTLISVQRAR